LNLKKVEEKSRENKAVLQRIDEVLSVADLRLKKPPKVRHLLEVLVLDLGASEFEKKVTHRMEGLRVAPYYGCQCLRPYPVFDDPEEPVSMEPFIKALGAEVHQWDMGGRCCGASHMNTKPEVGIELVAEVLKAAKGADVVVTVCPMCQMNLEAFQGKASRHAGEELSVPVLYLPQLLGLGLGLPETAIRLDLNLAVPGRFAARL
jgi:heterodisulfide reductase subunit B